MTTKDDDWDYGYEDDGDEPECPHCHRELIHVSRPIARRRIERAPARVGDMKAA